MNSDAGKGRCKDTIQDALEGVRTAQELLGSNENNKTGLRASILEYLQNLSESLRNLEAEWDSVDHASESHALTVHKLRVSQHQRTPLDIGKMILHYRLWENQNSSEKLSEESQFAELLMDDIFQELGIESIPEVVFGGSFQAIDFGPLCLVIIPYTFYRRYDRWGAISHEIGHLYYRRHPIDPDQLVILAERLSERIPQAYTSERQKDIENMLGNWVFWWSSELLSDLVGVSIFGLLYLLDLNQLDNRLNFSTVSRSHPPTSLRLACIRVFLEMKGVKLPESDDIFESDEPIPQWIDEVAYSLLEKEIAPVFIEWAMDQDAYCDMILNWQAILELGSSEIPSDTSLSTIFAALGIASVHHDVEDIFQQLKRKLKDKGRLPRT